MNHDVVAIISLIHEHVATCICYRYTWETTAAIYVYVAQNYGTLLVSLVLLLMSFSAPLCNVNITAS